MSQFTNVRCVLAVKDLEKSVAFYMHQLGFGVDFRVEGWAFLSRGAFRLMLGECANEMPAQSIGDHSYFAYVTVDAVDQFYEELLKNDVPRIQDLADKPWGMREFGIRTPDGHRIMFGQEIEDAN